MSSPLTPISIQELPSLQPFWPIALPMPSPTFSSGLVLQRLVALLQHRAAEVPQRPKRLRMPPLRREEGGVHRTAASPPVHARQLVPTGARAIRCATRCSPEQTMSPGSPTPSHRAAGTPTCEEISLVCRSQEAAGRGAKPWRLRRCFRASRRGLLRAPLSTCRPIDLYSVCFYLLYRSTLYLFVGFGDFGTIAP